MRIVPPRAYTPLYTEIWGTKTHHCSSLPSYLDIQTPISPRLPRSLFPPIGEENCFTVSMRSNSTPRANLACVYIATLLFRAKKISRSHGCSNLGFMNGEGNSPSAHAFV